MYLLLLFAGLPSTRPWHHSAIINTQTVFILERDTFSKLFKSATISRKKIYPTLRRQCNSAKSQMKRESLSRTSSYLSTETASHDTHSSVQYNHVPEPCSTRMRNLAGRGNTMCVCCRALVQYNYPHMSYSEYNLLYKMIVTSGATLCHIDLVRRHVVTIVYHHGYVLSTLLHCLWRVCPYNE